MDAARLADHTEVAHRMYMMSVNEVELCITLTRLMTEITSITHIPNLSQII